MDITKFTAKLKKAQRLSGHYPIDEDTRDVLHEALKHELDNDILHALKHLAYSSEKINIENILKHISDRKADRLREEKIKRTKEDQLAVRELEETKMPADAKQALTKVFGKNWNGGME